MVGKRNPIDVLLMASNPSSLNIGHIFDVHGGVTFSGSGQDGYPVKDELWYFGFDCSHYGDGKDYAGAAEVGLYIQPDPFFINQGVVRTKEYVEAECRRLADQLAELVTGKGGQNDSDPS
jgi:hypothetical protein